MTMHTIPDGVPTTASADAASATEEPDGTRGSQMAAGATPRPVAPAVRPAPAAHPAIEPTTEPTTEPTPAPASSASLAPPATPLPRSDDEEWRALPERMRRVWMANEAISCAITVAVCAVSAIVCRWNGWWDVWQPLVLALIAAYALLALAVQPVQTRYRYAFHRFRIGARDMRIRTGWLWRKSTTIPFNRVQHVDTKQGPVLRHYGMTTVVVHTAVGEHAIESLTTDEAERVVSLITARVAAAKEDV
ncbi:PH domain-containing protein [Bifidobacterium samirii]|uniref:Bacterial PH domain-containing protein n=1 Tax=Bifidobacterium samirii TaxID=2306974 RepID=A0A430FR50_9BIFI|nr:PH domain-containing protein [Bifidobacterium samirii]RSX55298.1 Bacterial PH domain-containing protein [Bifidobacterium samirii]